MRIIAEKVTDKDVTKMDKMSCHIGKTISKNVEAVMDTKTDKSVVDIK